MTDKFMSASKPQVRRDGYGRYMLPECTVGPARKHEVPFTRATTFAKSISDTYALSMWQQRMVAKGVALRQDLRLAAATMDVKGDKDALNQVVEQAKEAAEAKSAARLGSAVHAFTESVDRGVPVDAQEYTTHVEQYSALLERYQITVMPEMIERIVVWNRYSVAGTFDRIAMWKGQPVVLDLKTGRDLQYGWNEIAIQLAIYANADGLWNPDEWRWEPMPAGLRTSVALVLHLPVADGLPAHGDLYTVDLEPALTACRLCSEVREWRKTRGLATLLEPPEGEPSTDWTARITAASSKGDLIRIWEDMPVGDQIELSLVFRLRAKQLIELAG